MKKNATHVIKNLLPELKRWHIGVLRMGILHRDKYLYQPVKITGLIVIHVMPHSKYTLN